MRKTCRHINRRPLLSCQGEGLFMKNRPRPVDHYSQRPEEISFDEVLEGSTLRQFVHHVPPGRLPLVFVPFLVVRVGIIPCHPRLRITCVVDDMGRICPKYILLRHLVQGIKKPWILHLYLIVECNGQVPLQVPVDCIEYTLVIEMEMAEVGNEIIDAFPPDVVGSPVAEVYEKHPGVEVSFADIISQSFKDACLPGTHVRNGTDCVPVPVHVEQFSYRAVNDYVTVQVQYLVEILRQQLLSVEAIICADRQVLVLDGKLFEEIVVDQHEINLGSVFLRQPFESPIVLRLKRLVCQDIGINFPVTVVLEHGREHYATIRSISVIRSAYYRDLVAHVIVNSDQ